MPVIPLGVIALAAVMYMLYIFANLSRRLGEVTKMRRYYRGFYAAMGFLAVPILARILFISIAFSPNTTKNIIDSALFALVLYHIPLVIGVAISVAIAWRYWSWLFKEKLH